MLRPREGGLRERVSAAAAEGVEARTLQAVALNVKDASRQTPARKRAKIRRSSQARAPSQRRCGQCKASSPVKYRVLKGFVAHSGKKKAFLHALREGVAHSGK